jgi:hypothetical protein
MLQQYFDCYDKVAAEITEKNNSIMEGAQPLTGEQRQALMGSLFKTCYVGDNLFSVSVDFGGATKQPNIIALRTAQGSAFMRVTEGGGGGGGGAVVGDSGEDDDEKLISEQLIPMEYLKV